MPMAHHKCIPLSQLQIHTESRFWTASSYIFSNSTFGVVTSQELDKAGFANDCSCTKLIQKRLESRSWIRTYQICKWVAILTFGVLREPAELQRHLADTNYIQYSPDRHSSYYNIWWTHKSAEFIYFKDWKWISGIFYHISPFPSGGCSFYLFHF